MKTLKQKWNSFANMVFDPWFLMFFVATALSLGFSILIKNNPLFSNLLAVFGSITGGIAGGIFQNEHAKITGENILRKKGQSAVRNLQSIQKQIDSLRCWVTDFAKKGNKDTKPELNEIDRHLSVIELNVNSGYEDWIDIDPTLRGEKEVQEKFNEAHRSFVVDLLEQQMKLSQSTDSAEKKELAEKIDQLEKQIKTMKKESASVLSKPLSYVVRGVNGSSFSKINAGASYSRNHQCTICGNYFSPDYTKASNYICEDCRK